MADPKTTARGPLRNPHAGVAVTGAALLIALALAGTATAHVTISPPFAPSGVETELGLTVPNERRGHVTTALAVEAPPGVTLSPGTVPDGWRASSSPERVRWSGGRIAGEGVVRFLVDVTVRTEPGQVVFRATQTYEDGKTVRWSVPLTVVPGPAAEPPPQHLRRALTAGVVGLLVIAGSLLALGRARARGSLQER